jgi:hypothetical protein
MRLGVAVSIVLGLASPMAARAEPLRYGLRAETGAEYDSNAARTEEVRGAAPLPIVRSGLGRVVTSADIAATPTAGLRP